MCCAFFSVGLLYRGNDFVSLVDRPGVVYGVDWGSQLHIP
ncbi:hypothetical protein CLJ_A0001 (plasmid) [Clostridium botulinum Ba4 str. 657]|uniref:Uncharacterized protein n=1 Tax=Clostridium botulinum (strain 657 / Type Ba4) TaxID=515621 RepID=A0A3F2ZVY0_CLOB6|nr:hypothetical protein CLJ_A0001 [Clostridium botulinum Ba4 str. 657]